MSSTNPSHSSSHLSDFQIVSTYTAEWFEDKNSACPTELKLKQSISSQSEPKTLCLENTCETQSPSFNFQVLFSNDPTCQALTPKSVGNTKVLEVPKHMTNLCHEEIAYMNVFTGDYQNDGDIDVIVKLYDQDQNLIGGFILVNDSNPEQNIAATNDTGL